jgi:hypothetical protein
MKNLITLIVLSFSMNLFAAPIKTCNTVLKVPEEAPIPSTFVINEVDGKLSATVTQKIEGETTSYEDTAAVGDFTVREGLNEETDPDSGLNNAELLVVHAMSVESLGLKSGIVLSKVRGAKVFTIGEFTNMGGTAIVEARDGKGKILGSYLGGFLVSPCK